MQIVNIATDNLAVDAFNPRRSVDEKAIETLAKSVTAMGVLQPLIVRPAVDSQTRFTALAGSRRLRAGQRAGLTELPCIVRQLTDAEAAELALVEQDNHETLHYLELGEALQRWRDAGATVDEMAGKIDRKRATVYSLLGLAKLTPEAKRACWDKKLEEVAARELATYPSKVQGPALKEMLSQNDEGRARSAREQIDLLRARYRLDLRKSGFDPAAVDLHSEECGAPSCANCIHRTGVSPDLFDESTNPDLCTNPPGYRARQDAQWALQVKDGEHNRGPKCLPDVESKKIFSERGLLMDMSRFIDIGYPCHEDSKGRTYKELLGKGAPIVLARPPATRQVVELFPRQGLTQRLDEVGLIKRRKESARAEEVPTQSPAEKKAAKEKNEKREAVTKLVLAEVTGKLKARGPDKRFWRFLCDQLVTAGSLERVWERRDVQEQPAKYLDRLAESDLLAFFVEGFAEPDLYPIEGKYTPTLLELAKLTGVDIKEHEKTVTAAERAQPEVKKKGAK